MFESFDTNGDGRIDATELGRALGNYGYARLPNTPTSSLTSALLSLHVPPNILNRVVKKYSDPRYGDRLDLDQFVCASVVVRQMCNLYEKCNVGGGSNVTRDAFLLAVIALP